MKISRFPTCLWKGLHRVLKDKLHHTAYTIDVLVRNSLFLLFIYLSTLIGQYLGGTVPLLLPLSHRPTFTPFCPTFLKSTSIIITVPGHYLVAKKDDSEKKM